MRVFFLCVVFLLSLVGCKSNQPKKMKLKFVDEYINTTPNSLESKEEIVDKIEHVFVNEKEEEYSNTVEPI